jgi:excisionase family DNA binding protein
MLRTVTTTQKLAYSVEELAEATSLSKAHLRNEIHAGNLKAKKVGRRILILEKDALDYFDGFESAERKENKNS